jgi:DNA primase large subunit
MHPWVSDSNKVVQEYDLDGVLADTNVLNRAVERVVTGVNTGTIAMPTNPDIATEFLSYPVARILVSVIDDHRVTTRYIDAEADRSIGLLEDALWHPSADFDAHAVFDEFAIDAEQSSVFEVLSKSRREFASTEAHQQTIFSIPLEQYLTVSVEINDDEWSLLNRGVQDGIVHIEQSEVITFLRAAIKSRVADNLPVDVDEDLAKNVARPVDRVTENIDKDLFTHEIDRVEEGLFPPVIKSMLDDFPHNLEHDQKVTLAAFFLNIGMTPDETVEALGVVGTRGEDPTREQVEHIWQDGDPYMPANYETIRAKGYEWEMDALENKFNNPLSYYRIKLEEDSESEAFNWLDVYGENVSPMLTYPAGTVSMKMDDNTLPDGFSVTNNGATWTCDALDDQHTTGLALVAVVEGFADADRLSMKYLKEMDSTDAVDLCVLARSEYGFVGQPPTYALESIAKAYGFEFVSGKDYLSTAGKRDAQEVFDALIEERASGEQKVQ